MLKNLGIAALIGAVYAQSSALPTVDLGYEIYRASTFNSTGGFYNFSNIRYAAPPTGNLRFAAPQAPAVDRSSINNGNVSRYDILFIVIESWVILTCRRICPQASPAWGQAAQTFLAGVLMGGSIPNITYVAPGANSSSKVPTRDPRENEDCLFLDVFVPQDVLSQAGKGYGAPVLVWIYGGGYTGGNKNYNPAGLLAASNSTSNGDVIYVAMNYRLGAFGWQSGPSFQAEGGVANVGLHDQRFALEWVQNNIHLFGGDKNRVTVFGESAGGGSIMHQITAYGGLKGKAPFQQAVPQSPGWAPVVSNVQQENTYQKFLNLTNTTSLAQLRALPSEVLIRANAQQVAYDAPWGTYIYGPVVDGSFAPQQPGQLLAQGRFDKDIRVMVGHQANEGAYFTAPITTEQGFMNQLKSAYPYAPQQSLNYLSQVLYPPVYNGSYGYTNEFTRASLVTAEGVFTCNTEYLSRAYGNKTYSYLFAVPPALHGFDVPYTYYDGGALSSSVVNRTVAIALQEFITSFAKDGRPAADRIRQFNMYGPDARVLELNIQGISEVRDSNANARCAWWQKALY